MCSFSPENAGNCRDMNIDHILTLSVVGGLLDGTRIAFDDRCGKLSEIFALPCGRRVATGGLWGCASPQAGQTRNRRQKRKKGPREANKACQECC